LATARRDFPWLGAERFRDIAKGLSWLEDEIRGFRTSGLVLLMQYALALKSEALHLVDRTSEALETINRAELNG
jgi:hypothetical protein